MTATIALISEQGYRAATADEIARRAGVSKGLLWHYFTDLGDLLEATAHHALAVLTRAAADQIDLTAPTPEVIRSAIHAAVELRVSHGAERRAIREIHLNLRTPAGAPRLTQADLADLYAGQTAILQRGQQTGDVRGDLDPALLAVTYQGAVDSMLTYLDAHPDANAETHAQTVADALLNGITPRH